jgi:hypothetical protein
MDKILLPLKSPAKSQLNISEMTFRYAGSQYKTDRNFTGLSCRKTNKIIPDFSIDSE